MADTRIAPADDLAVGRQVGRHAVAFLAATPGQPEAGDDLIEDEQRPGGAGHPGEVLEEARRGPDDAVQRLDDDGRDRTGVRRQLRLDRGQVVERRASAPSP